MNQSKLNFNTEKLVVDYIFFKFQHLDNFTQTKITNYLFKLGFNSYQESGKLTKPIRQSILGTFKNKFQVCFVGDNSLLNISGSNAARFYTLVQKEYIDSRIFSSAVLSQFDLYFKRNYKITDKISVREFLVNCQKNLKQKNKNYRLEKNTRSLILKIGNRRSNNYSRIYETKNFLRFEHEMLEIR